MPQRAAWQRRAQTSDLGIGQILSMENGKKKTHHVAMVGFFGFLNLNWRMPVGN
jgi:hypothetical protein